MSTEIKRKHSEFPVVETLGNDDFILVLIPIAGGKFLNKRIKKSDIGAGISGLANVVEDVSPQLGGDLDLNGHDLIGDLSVDNFDGGTDASVTTFLRGDGTWQTPVGGGADVPVGNTLYVDIAEGASGSGTDGSLAHPYSKPEDANIAAVAPCNIVVRAGTYSCERMQLREGVNWQLEVGAVLNADADDDAILFLDSVGVKTQISGFGIFGSEFVSPIIQISHASSRVTFRMEEVTVTALGVVLLGPVLNQSAGYLKFNTTGSVADVQHTNGELHLTAATLTSFTATASSIGNTQHVFVNADVCAFFNINGAGSEVRYWLRVADCSGATCFFDNCKAYLVTEKCGYGVQVKQTVSGTQVWVTAQKVTGIATAGESLGPPIWLRGGFSVWNIGDIDRGYVGIGALASIICAGGKHQVLVQSLQLNATAASENVQVSGGTLDLKLGQVRDDLSGSGKIFNVSGGTCLIDGMDFVAVSSVGGTISGGTLRLRNSRINLSAVAATVPITKSGGTLVLDHSTIVGYSLTDCVYAPTSQTVVSNHSSSNRVPNANVTFTGTGLFVDSTIV